MATWDPRKLSPRHRKIMRLFAMGLSQRQIAAQVGMSEVQLSKLVNSPSFKEQFSALQEKLDALFVEKEVEEETKDPVRELLRQEAIASLKKIIALRDSARSEQVQLQSAFDLLDRAGYKSVDKREVSGSFELSGRLEQNVEAALADLKKIYGQVDGECSSSED